MADLRTTLGACGFDPSYEKIMVEALKRGRNGEGRSFEVDVIKRTGEHLGIVALRGDENGIITGAIDQLAFSFEDRVEILGQRVADMLVERLAERYTQGGSGDPEVYTRV